MKTMMEQIRKQAAARIAMQIDHDLLLTLLKESGTLSTSQVRDIVAKQQKELEDFDHEFDERYRE